MTAISKRDAMKLVADIKRVKVAGHAIGVRTRINDHMPGFLGGLESVLQHFLRQHGCSEAAEALAAAMNYVPTEAEITEHDEEIVRWRAAYARSAA
jgi:hypothetical protein